jgi:hypothetical protein
MSPGCEICHSGHHTTAQHSWDELERRAELAESRLAASEARVKELEDGLKPFGLTATAYEDERDEFGVDGVPLRHFRRAGSLLSREG